MSKQEDTNVAVLKNAELAIKNNEHRARLLIELWESFELPAAAVDHVFLHPPSVLTEAAEHELLTELSRMRSLNPQEAFEGVRPRRPIRMRGMLI